MGRADLKNVALEVARKRGIARARDFGYAGVPRVYLQRLQDDGLLVRTGRGRYQLANVKQTAAHPLAEVSRAVPRAIIGLSSALHLHGLLSDAPDKIWLLLPPKAWAPTSLSIPVRIVRASGRALLTGIETRTVDGVNVPVTSISRSIADCFKHRSKLGTELAIDALRACSKVGAATLDELSRDAKLCRVQSVMRPYLEAFW